MSVNLQTLATEITTDPNTYGYAARVAAGDDAGTAALLNLVRDGTNGAAIPIRRIDITPAELLEQVAIADFVAAMTTNQQAYWLAVMSQPSLRILADDGTNSRILNNLATIVTGAASQNRVKAIAVRNGSRAEALFGRGSVVTVTDVAAALGRV